MMAVAVTALILAAATVGGFAIAACGDSSDGTAKAAVSGPSGGGQTPDMSAACTQALDRLVEQGTITSEQADAVLDALAAAMPSPGAQPQGELPSPG